MMGLSIALLVCLALPIICVALLWLGMIVDVLITSSDAWLVTGHDRWFCLLMVIGLGPIGAALQLVFVRPRLARAEYKMAVERAELTMHRREAA